MTGLKEWMWCTLCYAYALLRGKAKHPPATPARVVIVQMAKLGDMVCTTPLFRAIKEAYPECQVSIVGNAVNKALLEGNADVDDYILYQGPMALIRSMRRGQYDFACLTGPNTLLLSALFLGGVRSIAAPRIAGGASSYETLAYRRLLRLVIERPHTMGTYAPREYLRLAEPLGIRTENTRKHLAYSPAAAERMQAFWAEHGLANAPTIIGITPSAGNKTKLWPAERFAELIALLAERHSAKILLLGSDRDAEEMQRVRSLVPASAPVIEARSFSLDELKACVARLSLMIGVDTGPIYIAEAFDVPTVDIVGPVDEREQPPQGKRHRIVVPPFPRTPQLHIMDVRTFDPKEVERQIQSITVSMVYMACEELL